LAAEIEDMRSALCVIQTWAAFDLERGSKAALEPQHVVNLCEKALKNERHPRRCFDIEQDDF
jgi:hypothetical protein